ncbi:hypothetical protein, partial [uncultured Dubosiella sp.]
MSRHLFENHLQFKRKEDDEMKKQKVQFPDDFWWGAA